MKLVGVTAPTTGSGKTTVTLALLHGLGRALPVKIGPDYIDPMLHTEISGIRAVNMDRWLQGRAYRKAICRQGEVADYAVLEGVMGLYDSGSPINASTDFYFRALGVKYLLVVDVSRVAESAYYISRGFMGKRCLGVIINNYRSQKHLEMVERPFREHSIRIWGEIPYSESLKIPERHLGLYTPSEISRLHEIAREASRYIDFSFTDLLEDSRCTGVESRPAGGGRKVYVAMDEAFSFYYASSLDFLSTLGTVAYFSPLRNEAPDDASMVYIGGGYPELHYAELSRADRTRRCLRDLSEAGVPIMAECGGLMYLEDHAWDGKTKYGLVGIFGGEVTFSNRLTLAYTELLCTRDNFLFRKGERVRGHEFHYSSVSDAGEKVFRNLIGKGIDGSDGLVKGNTIASYSHIDLSRYGRRLARAIGH